MELIQKVSEYDQEIPQSHTADQLSHGTGKESNMILTGRPLKQSNPLRWLQN